MPLQHFRVLGGVADDNRRTFGERDERKRHAFARRVHKGGSRLAQLRQPGTHDCAVVDEQRNLQRVIVFGHAQHFARDAVLAHDEIFDGEIENRRAVLVDDARIDGALVSLSECRTCGAGHEKDGDGGADGPAGHAKLASCRKQKRASERMNALPALGYQLSAAMLSLPRIQHADVDAVRAAALRLREERGRVAVLVDEQIAVVDAEAPVRRVGAAEDLDAAADVLGDEHLRADRIDVVAEHLCRHAGRERHGADAAGDIERHRLPAVPPGKKTTLPE